VDNPSFAPAARFVQAALLGARAGAAGGEGPPKWQSYLALAPLAQAFR